MNNINKRKIVNEIFINEHNGKYQNYKHTHIHSYIYKNKWKNKNIGKIN